MRTRRLLLLVAFLLVPVPSSLGASAPLRIVGTSRKVTFQENGQTQTYFRIEPGKSLRLATSGSMLLLVPARRRRS